MSTSAPLEVTEVVALLGLIACRPPAASDADSDVPTVLRERTWVAITDAPCALDAEGRVACWASDELQQLHRTWVVDGPPDPEPYERLHPAGEQWGVRADGGFAHGIVTMDHTPEYFTYLPQNRWLEDLSTFWARDGNAIVWFNGTEPLFPEGASYRRAGGTYLWPLALDAENLLYVGYIPVPTTEPDLETYELPADLEVVDLANAGETACVLDTTGVITCFDEHEGLFDDPPYVMLKSAGPWGLCAVEADHDIVCTDGTTRNWGPLRDLVVTWSDLELVDAGTPDERLHNDGQAWGDDLSVCAITASNAIRCAGQRYDWPDLQSQLPAGD